MLPLFCIILFLQDKLPLKERMINWMEENKFAHLDQKQLQELSELENKLGVTLVAYDTTATFNGSSNELSSS